MIRPGNHLAVARIIEARTAIAPIITDMVCIVTIQVSDMAGGEGIAILFSQPKMIGGLAWFQDGEQCA